MSVGTNTNPSGSETASSPHRVARPGRPPIDRFEHSPSKKVGAHRQQPRPRYVWQWLLVSGLAVVLLTGAGIVGLTLLGGSSALPLGDEGQSQPFEEPVEGKLDPEASVAVLNGTKTPNLAAALDQLITENEWGTILFSGTAASSDVEISAVFYSNGDSEAAAKGLAAELGGVSTYVSEDYLEYGADLVVLLGADYAGPGFDEAAELTEAETADGAPADLTGGAGDSGDSTQ